MPTFSEISFPSSDGTRPWPRLRCSQPGDLLLDAVDQTATGEEIPTSGSLRVSGNIKAERDLAVTGSLSVTGIADLGSILLQNSGQLSFQGDGQISTQGSLGVYTGSPTPTEKLRIHADGALTVNGATELKDTLSVVKNVTFEQNLAVKGGSSLNGNVGIGTTSPTNRLHVVAEGARPATMFESGGSAYIGFRQTGAPELDANIGSRHLDGGFFVETFNPDSLMAFRVLRNGNVGIGAVSPVAKLQVDGDLVFHAMSSQAPRALPTQGTLIWNDGAWLRLNQNLDFTKPIFGVHTPGLFAPLSLNVGGAGGWGDPGGGNVWIAGNVGIGTTTPGFRLDVADRMRVRQGIDSAGIWFHQAGPNNDRAFVGMASDNGVGLWGNTGANWGLIMNTDNGDVTISGHLGTLGLPATPRTPGWGGGIHTWDVEAEGTMWSRSGYQSGNRDLAENYAATTALEPGDVVCLDLTEDKVALSKQPNDVSVIGVVSTAPGVLLNENHDVEAGKLFPIALCGRVPCKVVAENGPIQRGDLLTSSSIPGYAMKAQPITIGDHTLYRPGTIIGKALGVHTSGRGMVEVFVSLR